MEAVALCGNIGYHQSIWPSKHAHALAADGTCRGNMTGSHPRQKSSPDTQLHEAGNDPTIAITDRNTDPLSNEVDLLPPKLTVTRVSNVESPQPRTRRHSVLIDSVSLQPIFETSPILDLQGRESGHDARSMIAQPGTPAHSEQSQTSTSTSPGQQSSSSRTPPAVFIAVPASASSSMSPTALAPTTPISASGLVDQAFASQGMQIQQSHFYQGLYSRSTGLDVVKILGHIAQRPNPRIELGNIDLSAAIVVCAASESSDDPIIYSTEAFEELTGYSRDEVIGRNCRFLQAPPGHSPENWRKGMTNVDELPRLSEDVRGRKETQVQVFNFKKDGQGFVNLLSVVPVTIAADEDAAGDFLVGFMASI